MKIRKNKLFIVLLFIFAIFMTGCLNTEKFTIGTDYIEKTMYVGDKSKFSTNKSTLETGETVEWKTGDASIATVDDTGYVIAIASGDTVISATLGNYTCLIKLHVVDKDESLNVSIEITGQQTVVINETIKLSAKISKESFNQNVTWISSDINIASVSNDGVVKGVLPGVVTISAISVVNDKIKKDIVILVRTGSGIQDIIYNYINQNTYITKGEYDLTSLSNKTIELVKKVEKSVIGVTNQYIKNGVQNTGTGTAGIYKVEEINNGYKYTAFTNHHVIENYTKLQVYLGDVDEYIDCSVIKSDETMDLAIITFEYSKYYEPLKLGVVGSINNGEFVVAIGNPGGYTYYGSVTFGMISSTKRQMKDNNVVYVQHDAPINPGNSGGPLFNLRGEVVGINTLKLVSTDIEGMGFAIAMETFLDYLE